MRLGKNQVALLKKMYDNNLVIRHTTDYADNSESIVLEDEEADNTYENIPRRLFESLPNELLIYERHSPSIYIDIWEYRLSEKGKEVMRIK